MSITKNGAVNDIVGQIFYAAASPLVVDEDVVWQGYAEGGGGPDEQGLGKNKILKKPAQNFRNVRQSLSPLSPYALTLSPENRRFLACVVAAFVLSGARCWWGSEAPPVFLACFLGNCTIAVLGCIITQIIVDG